MRINPAITIEKRLLRFAPKRAGCLSGSALACLQNMKNSLVFVYLHKGGGFWIFLEAVKGRTASGYALRENRWLPVSIALSRIAAFY